MLTSLKGARFASCPFLLSILTADSCPSPLAAPAKKCVAPVEQRPSAVQLLEDPFLSTKKSSPTTASAPPGWLASKWGHANTLVSKHGIYSGTTLHECAHVNPVEPREGDALLAGSGSSKGLAEGLMMEKRKPEESRNDPQVRGCVYVGGGGKKTSRSTEGLMMEKRKPEESRNDRQGRGCVDGGRGGRQAM
eukprot:1157658-Pelagomonas_calceolata.AAC.5